MFKVDEEFFDLELDDDFFQDAFNTTSKSSTAEMPINLNHTLLKQHDPGLSTVERSILQEASEISKVNKFNEASSCTKLQPEINLPVDQLVKKGQPLNGTNSAKPIPSSDGDMELQKIVLPSPNDIVLKPEVVIKASESSERGNDLPKGATSTGHKRLPFLSYEDEDLNSIFSFESTEECFNVSEFSGKHARTLESTKPEKSKYVWGKSKASTNQSSFGLVKNVAPLRGRTVSDTSHNFSKQNNTPTVNAVKKQFTPTVTNEQLCSTPVNFRNKQLSRGDMHIQKENSLFNDVSPKVNNSPFLNQNTPKNRVSSSARKRKFPGPAGILPELPPGADLSNLSEPERPIVSVSTKDSVPQDFVCSQSLIDEFEKPPWQMMLKDLAFEESTTSVMDKFNISWVLQQAKSKQLPKGKVPVLCIILKNISIQGSEARVTFADKTGEVNGMIHGKLLEEHQEKLQPGAVLVLKQVTVFSPNSRKHYLIITPSNIISLYGVLGDKTSVISCSGSQLMAMAEEWMQEVIKPTGSTAGNKQLLSCNSPCLQKTFLNSPTVLPSPNDPVQELYSQNFPSKLVPSSHATSSGTKMLPNFAVHKSLSPSVSSSVESEIHRKVVVTSDVHVGRTAGSSASDCTEQHPTNLSATIPKNSTEEEESAAFEDEFDDLFLNLDEEALLGEKW